MIIKLLAEQGDQDAIEKMKLRREYFTDYCRRNREKQRGKTGERSADCGQCKAVRICSLKYLPRAKGLSFY